MKPEQDHYPVFEANQVLTNTHLNQVFDYLDEQDRLTRANLIGIGIVCGLELKVLTASETRIHISKGCGVTSEGYLIVEPEEVVLESYRADYKIPDEPAYPSFKDPVSKLQYPLWEMFPAGEPETTLLGAVPNFLDDKVVLLFLELKKEGLRNCSPNNCDDRGAEVKAVVRRLLIARSDLDKIIAAAHGLSAELTAAELAAQMETRLGLKDIRLPRYDVPNTRLATTKEVLAGFFEVFRASGLVSTTSDALTAAYLAFKPVLEDLHPANPFADFEANFGFLDSAPQNTAQTLFLQYFYDLFDDLLKGYDEFRWTGAELLCACCPPEGLFPRHLMLGEIIPSSNAGLYRQTFLASPAIGGCERRTGDLRLLFQRLVEMVRRFTAAPPLPPQTAAKLDPQIRITPSTLSDAPLSARCIPYYYTQDGDPPLFQLWNAEKTRRGRAAQNLSYRAEEYAAEPFVRTPLRYDLEPHNFLRIEGHLGKDYRTVLRTLLALRSQFRLPIEIVALRTGAFTEKMEIDLSGEDCRFQDLTTQYRMSREELRCFLCKEMQFFYDISPETNSRLTEGAVPNEPLLRECAPAFRVKPGTLGVLFDTWYAGNDSNQYFDPDQINLENFIENAEGGSGNFFLFYLLYYLSRTAAVLPEEFADFEYKNFENRYSDLVKVAAVLERNREKAMAQLEGAAGILTWEEIDDRIEAILYACRLADFRTIAGEYSRRIREAKQKQFLNYFLQRHPAIQHKAGAPFGGTFIIVYHDDPDRIRPTADFRGETVMTGTGFNRAALREPSTKLLSGALTRLQTRREIISDPDVQLIFAELTGQIPTPGFFTDRGEPDNEAERVLAETVKQLVDGTVIADFFLSYQCCSDCAPVQFVLPPLPLSFGVKLDCTNADGVAEVEIRPEGGAAPFTYRLDAEPFQSLAGKIVVRAGAHTIVLRDSAGVESAPQAVNVPEALTIGAENFTDDAATGTWRVGFNISGGTPPYSADSGEVMESVYISQPVPGDTAIRVEISDSAGCKTSREFRHAVEPPCDLPCNGIALRCGYRFWLPEPEPNRPYRGYRGEVQAFTFEFPEGGSVDLRAEVNDTIQATPDELNADFNNAVQSWMKRINRLIADKTGSQDWLRLSYSKLPTDTVGTLMIEYFECLKFEFRIQSTFQRPELTERLDMIYGNKGTTIQPANPDLPAVFIPAFDCIEINKCHPERPVTQRCRELDVSLRIAKALTRSVLTLDVEPVGSDQPVAFLWEVQDADPPVSDQKKARFRFTNVEPPVKTIRLTVFTERGCTATAVDSIRLRNA